MWINYWKHWIQNFICEWDFDELYHHSITEKYYKCIFDSHDIRYTYNNTLKKLQAYCLRGCGWTRK